MKKIITTSLFIISLILFFSCTSEENAIKEVVNNYQKAVNSNDKKKITELFETSSKLGLEFAFAMLDAYREQGISTTYSIDVLEVKVNGNIAEAKLKTSVTYSGEDKETIAALQMFTPSVVDTIMTFRKTNNVWKIVAEKSLD